MNDILMESKVYIVNKILKSTKAKFFKDIKEGNRLRFSVPLKYAGISRGRSYAVNVNVVNLSNDTTISKTFNQLSNLLDNLEILE